MPRRTRNFTVNCCIKIHNAHFNLLVEKKISGIFRSPNFQAETTCKFIKPNQLRKKLILQL